jgi:hypothetical protein
MLVHTVVFWLKEDTTDEQHAAFRKGLESLSGIAEVKATYVGTPATTDRPIVDRSYSFCLTNIFDTMADHDAYQVHPIHDVFVEECATPHVDKIVIYDAD